MNTLVIELTNKKAYQLLKDMEELKLIKVLKQEFSDDPKLSSLRGRIKNKMSNEDIDRQLNALRNEWQQDI